MSLKVWLPLDGDLRNLGCSGIEVTNNGATIDNSGKIGKCYYFDGNGHYLQLSESVGDLYSGDFSWAVWLKPTDSTRSIISSEYSSTGSSNVAFELSASRGVRIYWNGNPDIFPSNSTLPIDTWTHVAITKTTGVIKTYLNGELKHTYTGTLSARPSTSKIRIGDDYRGGTSVSYMGYMNDWRLYDHCLSAAEVHEIAMGLVLHYKLNNNLNIGNNLLPNSLEMNLGTANASTGTWRLAGTSNMSRARVAIADTPEGSGYGFQNSGIQTANDGSCYGIDNFPLEPNTVYIISMWARIIEGTEGYAGFNVYSSTPINGWSKIDRNYYLTQLSPQGEWTKCYMTFMTNASMTRNIYIGITTGDTSVTTQMCNVHIEKGIIQDNIIQDSSGYGHHGIAASDLIYSTNTPRYNSAYTFNGNVSHRIHYDENTFNYTDNFSYVLWCRANYTGTATQYLFTVGRADMGGYGYGIQNNNSTNLIMRFGNQMWNTQIETNTWTHIAFVKSGTTIKIYKNGILYSTNTFSGTLPTYSDGKGLGLGCFHYSGDIYPGYGAISDFRIYCTPLLDNDIKMLYNVSMKVDNLGGVHAFELNEKDNNLLAGIMITASYGNRINPYTKYNSNGELYFDTNGSSAGTNYIPINPTNHTYYYDFDISVNAGNQFDIGFERYDANKTSRSNNACTYIYASNSPTDINHKHIFGTVDLSTDGVNPCAFVTLRILNGWSGTTSGVVGTTTIHNMSLREISTIQNQKASKNGILSTGEFKEYQKAAFYKNGFIESTEFIEI